MITILWFSRHQVEEDQVQELRDLYAPDKIEIIWIPDGYGSDEVDKIVTELEKYDPVDLVVVMPIPMLAELSRRGVKPLRAVMKRRVKPDGNKVFSHIKFERYDRVEIKIVEPKPCNQRQGIKEKKVKS